MTTQHDPILRVENISKSYGDVEVLKGVSFNVAKGETKVFIGPSGTGKSTLLRCINQLTIPDGGHVYLHGEAVTHAGKNINRYRQKIGMVFQNFHLFDHLTALKNVAIPLIRVKKIKKHAAMDRAMQELEKVGMQAQADLYPAELSGGQMQRVSIARSLAMDPDVMLFDEPTSALDPELTREVLKVMNRLAAGGMTMLVVTHEMGFAYAAANEIIFMENGNILESGPPSTLVKSPRFERTQRYLSQLSEFSRPPEGDEI